MKISKLLLAGAITTSSLFAHGLWLNSFEAKSHGGSLVTVGFGSGHNLTIEDSITDRIELASFDLTTPYGKTIALKKPQRGLEDIHNEDGLKIVDSNLAMQKIILGKESKRGTYSANFATKTGMFTKYFDTNDKMKFSTKTKDKIRNLKKVISSSKNTTYAKTYFVHSTWSEPIPVGHKLEIIPTSDISKLYVGDTINLKVLYKGKPLESGYITAKNSLSKGDNALFSTVKKGKAKFVLTNFGQWSFNINVKEKGEVILSDSASATINIK